MKYYIHVLKNYVNFQGRARRAEYWQFTLINMLIFLPLYGVIIFMVYDSMTSGSGEMSPLVTILGGILGLYALATFLPGLAVLVRRLHDVNKSGWFILIQLIPLAGPIILLVKLCTEGDKGTNQYGSDPKGGSIEIDSFGKPETITN
jgi:uncharacterized membrane protein YhaH (DUF805 family)